MWSDICPLLSCHARWVTVDIFLMWCSPSSMCLLFLRGVYWSCCGKAFQELHRRKSMHITADKVLQVRRHDFRRCCHEWCCSQVHVSEIHGWWCSSSKKKTCTIDHFIISSCGATFVLRCLVMPLEPHLISSWCVFDRFLPCHEKRKSFYAISSLHLHLAVLCVFRHDHAP